MPVSPLPRQPQAPVRVAVAASVAVAVAVAAAVDAAVVANPAETSAGRSFRAVTLKVAFHHGAAFFFIS